MAARGTPFYAANGKTYMYTYIYIIYLHIVNGDIKPTYKWGRTLSKNVSYVTGYNELVTGRPFLYC